MQFYDRLKFTTTGTSAASLSDGTAVLGCRNIAKVITDTAGQVNALLVTAQNVPFTIEDGTGKWEDSLFNLGGTAASPTLTRVQVLASSAGGTTPETFTGATLTVFNTVPGKILSCIPVDSFPTTFSTTVPLTQIGTAHMPRYTVAGNLTFTAAANAVRGAFAEYPMISDGASTLVMSNFVEHESSTGVPTAAGVPFTLMFWNDGYTYWWSGSKAAYQGTDTIAPVMAGTLSSSAITTSGFTLSWSAASDNVAVTGYEVSTNGGSTYTNVGGVLTWTATGLTANTAYSCAVRAYDAANNKAAPITATVTTAQVADSTPPVMTGSLSTSSINQSGFTVSWSAATDNVGVTGYEVSVNGGSSYTDVGNVLTVTETNLAAGTTYQIAVRAYDAANNKATPLTTSVTTSAATAPNAPTIGAASPGDTQATVTWTAPTNNGGSAITGYTITSTPGNITATAAAGATSGTVTGLTNGTSYTFTVHATNAIGNSPESAASNSVTPAAAATNVRLNRVIQNCTESSGTPWKYTGAGGSGTDGTVGAVSMVSKPSGVNGAAIFKVESVANGFMVQIGTGNTVNAYSNNDCIWNNAGTYAVIPSGGSVASPLQNTVTAATGDWLKIEHTNANTAADFTVTTVWSVSKDNGNTWTQLYTKNNGRLLAYYAKVVPAGASVLSCLSATGYA
jgi:hypothetical protein